MKGETQLKVLLQNMNPKLNAGDYVFVVLSDLNAIDRRLTICEIKEPEGITVVLEKRIADTLKLDYNYIASWITLTVHSALEAVGLTAAFSTALAKHNISCNVIAGYYHDHIFLNKKDAEKAMQVLNDLSATDR